MAYPDFNPAQPPAIRRLNQRFAGIKVNNNFSRRNSRQRKKLCNRESAVELLQGFGEKTTIHGLNRLLQRGGSKYERCFWFLTLGVALCGTIYVSIILSGRFRAGTLQSVVQNTGLAVYQITFPAITICNANHLNWHRLDAAKQRFLPNETNGETLRMFDLVIGLYDNVKFGRFDVFDALENEPVHLVDKVDFTEVFDFMTWKCDELLTNCVWRHRNMSCCDIFLKRRSKNGICWTFNTLETEEGKLRKVTDAKYPWRTGSSGPESALMARVLVQPEKHVGSVAKKGITVMINEPTVWHRDPVFVPENTHTSIDIEPTIYLYDEDTRTLTPEQRECFFSDERNNYDFKTLPGFVYMIENCQTQCHQEYLERYCNCTLDLLFPPGPGIPCRAKDLICLARNNDHFRYTHNPGEEEYVRNYYQGMVCKCYHNCYSLQYMTYVRPTFLPADVRGNISYVDLDVHFRAESMMVYSTNLVFSWIDLMVAFGGIAGLFLGCSLISAVEVFYFAFIELPVFAYVEVKQTRDLKRDDSVQSNTPTNNQSISPPNDMQPQRLPKLNIFKQNRIQIDDNYTNNLAKNNWNLNYSINKPQY